MAIYKRWIIVATCLLLIAGCITDELAVYKDSVVSKDALKPFLGVYQVEEWPGDDKPESVRVAEDDGELSFSYSLPDRNIQARFILSKIPNSKKDLYLLSIPAQAETDQANMFFVGKADKDQTYIWAVFSNLPVTKDHLSFIDGKAKAEDVKSFLATHADAFVAANEPQVKFKNEKR
jgi:hypothetical protein